MNIYVIAAIVAGTLAFCAGIFHLGMKYERADWQTKETARKEAQLRDERAATKRHREEELRQAAIDTELQKTRKERDGLKAADRKRALDGELRLRVPGICPMPAPDASPSPGQRNAETDGELPREIAANLFDLANDADQVVLQLAACQQLVMSDRALR